MNDLPICIFLAAQIAALLAILCEIHNMNNKL